MYTDFNNFFTVRTRNLWRIKEKLLRPPHLYYVTALPSKTHTTANIDAHVWSIDVNGPSATTKVTAMLNKNIQTKLQCSICSCTRAFMTARSIILAALNLESLKPSSAVLTRPRTATARLPFGWSADVKFLNQMINTCHRSSLVQKLFY